MYKMSQYRQHFAETYPNGPEAGRETGWDSEFVPLNKIKLENFPCCTKFHEPHVLEYAHF